MKDSHNNKIFWFVVGCTSFVFVYIVGITFLPIPKDSVRFADTNQGFLLGTVLGACISYFLGGNPNDTNKSKVVPGDKIEVSSTTLTTTQTTTNEQEIDNKQG